MAENSWAKSSVEFVAGLGLFTGTGADTFSGELPMTRGMLVTVLHRFSGGLPAEGEPFGDVTSGAWYADAVTWAAQPGIVTGVANGRFAPESELTRETLAVMLYRYAGFLGLDTASESSALDGYPDSSEVSAWAGEAMDWAVRSGILTGKGAAGLAPGDSATRYEVAAMLRRLIENVI